jgi:Spy/CpxP family protein refolding chaperone
MKRYTLRAAIHDAKIFNQLRLEYRRTNKRNQVFANLDRPAQGVLVGTMKRNYLTLAAAGLIVLGGFAILQAQSGYAGGARGHGLERLTDGLNLTPDQQAKIQPIINQAQPQIAAIHREAMQKMKAVVNSAASQIRPLLTPDQQKKLDDNQNAHRSRRNAQKGPRDEIED